MAARTTQMQARVQRKKTTTRKISVNLTGQAEEIVTRLADDRGITISEVIRRALALADYFDRQTTTGAKVLVTQDKGKTFREIEFLPQ